MAHQLLAGDAAKQARRLPGARASMQLARVDLPVGYTLRLPGGAVRYGAIVQREVNGQRSIGLVPRRAADRKTKGTLYVQPDCRLILEGE